MDPLLGVLLLFILLQGLAGVIDGFRYYRYIREHLKSPGQSTGRLLPRSFFPAKVSTMNWNRMLKRSCARSIPTMK